MERLIVTNEDEIRRILREVVREIVREEVGLALRSIGRYREFEEEEPMTRKEMAAFLKISLVTLSDWVRRGLPIHRKRKRGRVLFLKSEVITWLRSNPDFKQSRSA